SRQAFSCSADRAICLSFAALRPWPTQLKREMGRSLLCVRFLFCLATRETRRYGVLRAIRQFLYEFRHFCYPVTTVDRLDFPSHVPPKPQSKIAFFVRRKGRLAGFPSYR